MLRELRDSEMRLLVDLEIAGVVDWGPSALCPQLESGFAEAFAGVLYRHGEHVRLMEHPDSWREPERDPDSYEERLVKFYRGVRPRVDARTLGGR